MEVSGIGGLIKHQGIDTIVLDLEYYMGKYENPTSKMSTNYLGRLSSSSAPRNGTDTEGEAKFGTEGT